MVSRSGSLRPWPSAPKDGGAVKASFVEGGVKSGKKSVAKADRIPDVALVGLVEEVWLSTFRV